VNAPTDIDFNGLKEVIGRLVENGDPDPAFLWDRLGHWAQDEENWEEAERAYRKAYELEPERYGYCLGTALNFLFQHTEALVVLLGHSAERQFDAMSWFQVAAAHAAIGSISESIDAYQRALELDPDYDLAWFNLGGVYWNSGDITRATKVWRVFRRTN
jgi:cytochrome c-type biogenesis protein CcmH/NrfG